MPTPISETADGVVVRVKVVAGSSKTQIAGQFGDMIKVKVSAVREKGKANKCLTEFLAKKLSLKKSDVRIVSGLTSEVKKIEIIGLTVEEATAGLCESNKKEQND